MKINDKIYVAGHNGLVGSAIVRKLLEDGYTNLIVKTHAELDLVNQQAVHQFFAVEKPEYVFLAAAKVGGIFANNRYRADFIYENLQIQNNVVHASYQNQVKKLLFLGSSCIYPKESPQPMTENCLLGGELEYTNEPYAIAKIAGIKLCESYNIQYGTNYLAVMPTNLYGPYDNFDLERSHVLPAIIRKLYLAKLLSEQNYVSIAKNFGIENNLKDIEEELSRYGITRDLDYNVSVTLWGSGKPYREFLHVDDMAEACIFIMNKINFSDLIPNEKDIKNTHINIGAGKDVTIKDLAFIIKEQIGFMGELHFDSSKPDGTMKKLQDISKLSKLGWQYKTDLREGVSQTIDWYIKESQNVL